jgi:6-phosphogluconate dehydrogenase
MQLGMIGLGRMGANMVRRLVRDGHQCVVYDVNQAAVAQLADEGASGATDLDDFVRQLARPRNVWIMVPAAYVEATIGDLTERLSPDDAIIDGGNSYYRDDIDRAELLAPRGIRYLDVGTSGGVFGLDRGYCLMVGGEDDVVTRLAPVFDTLAPGLEGAPRSAGRSGDPSPEENGWLHCGPHGAGHFVKMVHNGIEYGLMAAYAEGFNVLHKADIGKAGHEMDAETTPLREPKYYQYDFDLPAISELWRRGSVVTSWLLDLTADALVEDPGLESFGGRVSDSGEGRWTVVAAVEEGVPIHVLSAALLDRFGSRGEGVFANKVLSAMRKGFGGHAEKPVAGI